MTYGKLDADFDAALRLVPAAIVAAVIGELDDAKRESEWALAADVGSYEAFVEGWDACKAAALEMVSGTGQTCTAQANVTSSDE